LFYGSIDAGLTIFKGTKNDSQHPESGNYANDLLCYCVSTNVEDVGDASVSSDVKVFMDGDLRESGGSDGHRQSVQSVSCCENVSNIRIYYK
jgi:hypothetical protein